MNKKKGGLLKELEQKIEANLQIQNEYERCINILTNRNDNYNYVYNETFKPDWSGKKYINTNIYKNILEYRQSLIDDICHNNNLIDWYKNKLEKTININNFLQRLYFFINFNFKKPNYYKYF